MDNRLNSQTLDPGAKGCGRSDLAVEAFNFEQNCGTGRTEDQGAHLRADEHLFGVHA